VVTVSRTALAGRTGNVAVGIRPEKLRLGSAGANSFTGRVRETAYVGVSTQYIVETTAGALTVYVQNAEPESGAIAPGGAVELSFDPEAAFVVDVNEDQEEEEK